MLSFLILFDDLILPIALLRCCAWIELKTKVLFSRLTSYSPESRGFGHSSILPAKSLPTEQKCLFITLEISF